MEKEREEEVEERREQQRQERRWQEEEEEVVVVVEEEEGEEEEEEERQREERDRARYQQQNQQRVQQQQQYRQARMQEAEQKQGLERILNKLQSQCVYCWYYAIEEEEEHIFRDCRQGGKEWQVYSTVKKQIQYAKYAACWGCGCPQSICGEYLTGGTRQCKYKDIILAGAVVGLLDKRKKGISKTGYEQICELAGQKLEAVPKAVQWLGKMALLREQQASQAAVVFDRLFNRG